jgi:uncharacterized membrane protein YebE (DUF533 family)
MGDRFFYRLWQGTAPLVLWAAHFFFCYLYAASGCRRETWAVLAGVTLAALAAAGWLAWQAWREEQKEQKGQGEQSRDGPPGLLRMARLGAAILALVAIAWSALALFVSGTCG